MSHGKRVESVQTDVTETFDSIDPSGAVSRVFDFTDQHPYDRVVIRFDPDDDIPHQLRIYESRSDDEPTETMAFQNRSVSFDPISVIGKGNTERLHGITPTIDNYDDVPGDIHDLWKSLGFAIVPEGEGWKTW